MSSDTWGTDGDPFRDDEGFGSSVIVPEVSGSSFVKRHAILGAVSVVVASAALVVALAGTRGYGIVGLSAVAYVLAVLADLDARRYRYDDRNYRRPLWTSGLRVVVFVTTLWIGWLAASALAGSI